MIWATFSRGATLAVLMFLAAPGMAGAADFSCKDPGFFWTATSPSINLRHVLCGVIKENGDVVGMHARAMADTAPVTAIDAEPAKDDGLYNTRVTFENGKQKNSTFFPDNCDAQQIARSILHAANNSFATAQPWGKLGCSAPPTDEAGFCRGPQGQRFVIRFGELKDGRVNTAFPQMGASCR